MHANAACADFFGLSSPGDYAHVVRALLRRDPLLSFALQKALRGLRHGDARAVSHVTPDPSGLTSALCGVRVTPCVWEEPAGGAGAAPAAADGSGGNGGGGTGNDSSAGSLGSVGRQARAWPALLVEHNTPFSAAEVIPRLMRVRLRAFACAAGHPGGQPARARRRLGGPPLFPRRLPHSTVAATPSFTREGPAASCSRGDARALPRAPHPAHAKSPQPLRWPLVPSTPPPLQDYAVLSEVPSPSLP